MVRTITATLAFIDNLLGMGTSISSGADQA